MKLMLVIVKQLIRIACEMFATKEKLESCLNFLFFYSNLCLTILKTVVYVVTIGTRGIGNKIQCRRKKKEEKIK